MVFLSLQKWSCSGKWLVPHLPKGCKGIVWCRMWPAPLSLGDTKGSYSSSSFSSWSAWNKYCKKPKPTDFSSYIQRRHCGEVESAHLHMKVFKMCTFTPPPPPCFPPPDGCTALLRHMGGATRHRWSAHPSWAKVRCEGLVRWRIAPVGMMSSSKCLTNISTKSGRTVSLISNVVHF